jgi:hypothetical protein
MDGRRARNVLGVGRNATLDDIRRAFRAQAIVTHPDRGGNAHAFTEIRAAFEALKSTPPAPTPRPRYPLPKRAAHIDVYDSTPRPRPRRDFADVLRGAMARDAQHVG